MIYGGDLVVMTKGLGMEEVITAPIAMAKSVCRAADRFRRARMFGPRHRVE